MRYSKLYISTRIVSANYRFSRQTILQLLKPQFSSENATEKKTFTLSNYFFYVLVDFVDILSIVKQVCKLC